MQKQLTNGVILGIIAGVTTVIVNKFTNGGLS